MTTETPAAEQVTRTERLVDLAGRLADDFATRAAEHDRDNSFPFENFEAMRREKYLALTLPDLGLGLGISFRLSELVLDLLLAHPQRAFELPALIGVVERC